ncbi:MAG: hypothetical protein GC164_00030 [Phycisphaera sp.]|nr:hypothetical protein [Phycisphaera sp.]
MSSTLRKVIHLALVVLCASSLSPSHAWAQTEVREADTRNVSQRMGDILTRVDLHGLAARSAFEWWSAATGISVVIDWRAMQDEQIEADTPITVELQNAPAGKVLGLMMQQLASPAGQELLFETTPWYVRIMTKNTANKEPVLRIYDVGDVLHEVPMFIGPNFDLNQALSNTSSGSGNGGSGGVQNTTRLFPDEPVEKEEKKTRAERGQELADLIMDTIEPTIWQQRGGQYASVRYFNGRLIVNAPLYVQEQIGIPSITPTSETPTPGTPGTPGNRASRNRDSSRWYTVKPLPKPTNQAAAPAGVTGVQPSQSTPVTGVQE